MEVVILVKYMLKVYNTIVTVTAHHQQQSEVLTYSPHIKDMLFQKAKCVPVVCGLQSGNVFSNSILHCRDCIMNLYHKPHTAAFHVSWTWTSWHLGQTCCSYRPLWWAAGLWACQLWSHERIPSPWAQADWIAGKSQVPWSFAADTCLVGTFTARVVLFLIL